MESKKGIELGPNSIHTYYKNYGYKYLKNLSKNNKFQTSKLYFKKKQRFKWTNAIDTTLYFMLIHVKINLSKTQ
jgi:hypothetical protein